MDSVDLDILKYMSYRENYNELKGLVTKGLCIKESWDMLSDFGKYYEDYPDAIEIGSDFKFWQRAKAHPTWKREDAELSALLYDSVKKTELPDTAAFLGVIKHLRDSALLGDVAEQLAAGKITTDTALEKIEPLHDTTSVVDPITRFTMSDLAKTYRTGGLHWRLEDLNVAVGPLKKGDLVIVGKRPEVGGTSFLVSEMARMLEQVHPMGNAVIFNNEEAPDKVYGRMVSAALGTPYTDLVKDEARSQELYDGWLGERSFDLVHDPSMTMHSIKKQLKAKPYDIIGVNVLLKIGGTGKKEDHDKLEYLANEFRKIASEHCPVILITQASPEAEGMAYIPQNHIYKSKTALQGEADVLIMIGTDEEIKEDVRYIHIAKNKLPPGIGVNPKYKHIKTKVNFDPGTGRYSSVHFTPKKRAT